MTKKNIKVILDTNVWISFLIGKRLAKIKYLIENGNITIIVTNQLLTELQIVTSREKLKKYFPKKSIKEFIKLLESIAVNVKVSQKHFICRDPKDNFLLDLIDISKADFLITGDKDLLELNPFKTAQILSPSDFEKLIIK